MHKRINFSNILDRIFSIV